jgi:hypothetical protein
MSGSYHHHHRPPRPSTTTGHTTVFLEQALPVKNKMFAKDQTPISSKLAELRVFLEIGQFRTNFSNDFFLFFIKLPLSVVFITCRLCPF